MKTLLQDPGKTLRIVTIILLSLMLAWGCVFVFFIIKPFWIDEWRLIWNIKFKSPAALWGPLDLTQQFPRVFLQLVKRFTAWLNYSYFSLRFPSLLLSAASMLLAYRLMNRLFPGAGYLKYLFVWILVSSETFTEYLVQMKQYEMEILLSLVAIWQLWSLCRLQDQGRPKLTGYILLCLSFLFLPCLSYTYPIALAPVYLVVLLRMRVVQSGSRTAALQLLPLMLGAISIIVFYIIDVRQLMNDQQMHRYWQYRMVSDQFSLLSISGKIWSFFAEVGSGAVYEVIFGILGIISFLFSFRSCLKLKINAAQHPARLYAVCLITLVILLFLAGKLPVGEPKFNAFTVPAIAILIIYLLRHIASLPRRGSLSGLIAAILFLGLLGNILSTIVNSFTDSNYARRVAIYRHTGKAIREAQARHIPLIVTPTIAWPDEITREMPYLVTITADIVAKTWPEYPVHGGIPVYIAGDIGRYEEAIAKLPPDVKEVITCDSSGYRLLHR